MRLPHSYVGWEGLREENVELSDEPEPIAEPIPKQPPAHANASELLENLSVGQKV